MTHGNYSLAGFLSRKLVSTIAVLTLLTANLNAGVIINTDTVTDPLVDAATGGPNPLITSNLGTISVATITGTFGMDSVITATYTVSGLDLSSLEAGATNASFDFTLQFAGFNVDGAGNRSALDIEQFVNGSRANVALGVGNTNIDAGQEIDVTLSVSNITGFTGNISGLGFDQVTLGNAQNDDDAATVLFGDGTSFSFDNGGAAGNFGQQATPLGTLVPTDNFTVTGVDGAVRLLEIGVSFEATAAAAVPEPSSMFALGIGALGFCVRRRRNS